MGFEERLDGGIGWSVARESAVSRSTEVKLPRDRAPRTECPERAPPEDVHLSYNHDAV